MYTNIMWFKRFRQRAKAKPERRIGLHFIMKLHTGLGNMMLRGSVESFWAAKFVIKMPNFIVKLSFLLSELVHFNKCHTSFVSHRYSKTSFSDILNAFYQSKWDSLDAENRTLWTKRSFYTKASDTSSESQQEFPVQQSGDLKSLERFWHPYHALQNLPCWWRSCCDVRRLDLLCHDLPLFLVDLMEAEESFEVFSPQKNRPHLWTHFGLYGSWMIEHCVLKSHLVQGGEIEGYQMLFSGQWMNC